MDNMLFKSRWYHIYAKIQNLPDALLHLARPRQKYSPTTDSLYWISLTGPKSDLTQLAYMSTMDTRHRTSTLNILNDLFI